MYTPFGRNTYQSCLYNVYCYDYNQTKLNVLKSTFIYKHIFYILVKSIIHLFIYFLSERTAFLLSVTIFICLFLCPVMYTPFGRNTYQSCL